MSLAAITCHFNWSGYKRPACNVRRFTRQMISAGIPLFGIEAHLRDQKPTTEGLQGWRQIQVSQHAILFQKEALLNAAEKIVPESFDKIAWIDADVWFANPRWAEETDKLLDEFPLVQPFERAVWTWEDGDLSFTKPAFASLTVPEIILKTGTFTGHPGFAWAARRDVFREMGGLYPYCVTGSGDSLFASGLTGVRPGPTVYRGLGGSLEVKLCFDAWADNASRVIAKRIASVPGDLWHEWHGDRKNRNYAARHEYLDTFNPFLHLVEKPDGHFEWSPETPPEMMLGVKEHFAKRLEDTGIDGTDPL